MLIMANIIKPLFELSRPKLWQLHPDFCVRSWAIYKDGVLFVLFSPLVSYNDAYNVFLLFTSKNSIQ